VKRILIASAIAVTVMAAVAIGTAWGATGAPSSAAITFDDGAQQVTLQIPSPACPTTQPGCQWKFFLNEPKLSVDVATIYGTSGTLTLAYPPDFCGVIQADAYVGPPWVPKRGWQHTIATCTPSDTATSDQPNAGGTTATTDETGTTAVSSTTTTTNEPEHGGTNAPVTPVGITPSTVELPETQAAAVAPTVSPLATGASATTSAALPETAANGSRLTSLPFTGADFQPFVYLGTMFVVLGFVLMARRRRRPL
jgi:hypothetical protein